MAEKLDFQNDVLVAIQLRNDFYKEKYYYALGILVLNVLVIIMLGYILSYLASKQTPPLYFVTDNVGRLVPYIPLQTPNMSNDEVAAWVTEAIEATYSYDFINYREELQHAQIYFTNYGWNKYMEGLKASNNLVALNQRKLVILAKAVDKPKLITQGLLGKSFAWKFEVPLLVTYLQPPYDKASEFTNPLLVTVTVQRQNLLTSYKGLGILQMIGVLASAPEEQNLNPASAN